VYKAVTWLLNIAVERAADMVRWHKFLGMKVKAQYHTVLNTKVLARPFEPRDVLSPPRAPGINPLPAHRLPNPLNIP
jgi:hypothetical protein